MKVDQPVKEAWLVGTWSLLVTIIAGQQLFGPYLGYAAGVATWLLVVALAVLDVIHRDQL
jgi:uncharacterized membrane protein YtjA (UPF0391 family)